jgi:hypothetical protein
MATRSRPAQGDNSYRPYNRPAPAYKSDSAPRVVSTGTQQRPIPNPWARSLSLNVADATPKVVQL